MLQLRQKSNQNCRIGKKYDKYVFTRISDDEYDVNGVRLYRSMDGNWQSNPPINDAVLMHEVHKFFMRLKQCNPLKVCKPAEEFAGTERCLDCNVVK